MFRLLYDPKHRKRALALVEMHKRVDIWEIIKREKGAPRPMHGDNISIDGTILNIIWDEPMPGCHRAWFSCPKCGDKCRYVYWRKSLACRHCHQLDYRSRHSHGLHSSAATRLRLRIGVDPRPFTDIPRWKRTRWPRHVATIEREERALIGKLRAINDELERLAR